MVDNAEANRSQPSIAKSAASGSDSAASVETPVDEPQQSRAELTSGQESQQSHGTTSQQAGNVEAEPALHATNPALDSVSYPTDVESVCQYLKTRLRWLASTVRRSFSNAHEPESPPSNQKRQSEKRHDR